MSVTFTLMSRRPIFRSSLSTQEDTASRNLSRSVLISSICMVAIIRRIWPKMMSLASSCTSTSFRPSSRSAAFCMVPGSVEMPTVNRAGTSMRMFWRDRAFFRSTLMDMGVRSMYSYAWTMGLMNAAPPWMHLALRAVPSLLVPTLP